MSTRPTRCMSTDAIWIAVAVAIVILEYREQIERGE